MAFSNFFIFIFNQLNTLIPITQLRAIQDTPEDPTTWAGSVRDTTNSTLRTHQKPSITRQDQSVEKFTPKSQTHQKPSTEAGRVSR